MKKQVAGIVALVSLMTVSAGAVASAASSHNGSATTHHAIVHNSDRKLDKAVKDGVITSAQKSAFEAELKTLRTERKNTTAKSSTSQERKAERTTLHTELKTWADKNNFPLAKVFPKLTD